MGVETKKKDLGLGFSIFGVSAYSLVDSNRVSKAEFVFVFNTFSFLFFFLR